MEHQEKEVIVSIESEIEKQHERWQQPDIVEKTISTVANGFNVKGDHIPVKLGNAFEKLVNGEKILENGGYESYDGVEVEERKDKSEMNVYYDQVEGIWKCQNCYWTYQSGSEHIEHPKWYMHMLIGPKTVNRQESCFYCEIKGLKSIYGFSATENNGVAHEKTHFNGKPLKEKAGNKYFSEITLARDDVEPVEESKEKSAEFDVEKVLEEQDTHDLYCPNCNSCITKRVLLRKRKPKTVISSEDVKRYKFEAVDDSLDRRLPSISDDNMCDSNAEVFRCLSCFSFFIPSGNGFQLFKVSGDKSDDRTSRPVSATKKSRFSSILTSHTEGEGSTRYLRDNILAEEYSFQFDTAYQNDSSAISNEIRPQDEKGSSVTQCSGKNPLHAEENDIHGVQQDGPKIQGHSTKESLTLENSHLIEKVNDITPTETADTGYDSGTSLTVTVETKTNTYFEEPMKAIRDNLIVSLKDSVTFPGKQVGITEGSNQTPAKSGTGIDTIITIKESVEPGITQEPQGLTYAELHPLPHTDGVEYKRFQGMDIVKSIVYGGLAEFLASLGIVSSAVGADTVTLKILALGVANLSGGMFVIGQKLWDLKNEQHSNPNPQIAENDSIQVTTQQDRYQQLLGPRENFWAHATIALLSFLIFGIVPPVIYAFSFRESDNKDHKLIAVAATSLVCILILSTGKAYIQRPPKAYLNTISSHVTMMLITSGVSYAFGDLFKKLLENLGLFSSDLDLTVFVLDRSI